MDDVESLSQKLGSNRSQLVAKHHLAIRKCFHQPSALSIDDLARWHEAYKAADGQSLCAEDAIIKEVQSDGLDEAAIEECLAELAEDIHVTRNFCQDCQHLFDNWPDLSDAEVKEPGSGLQWPGSGADWKHAVAQERHTIILEAGARRGCRFCAFLLQAMRDGEILDTMRRIEARLAYVGDNAAASLSVQNWGQNSSQLLWINFPGKVCDHCNSGIAGGTKFESAALESSADTYIEQQNVLDIAKSWLDTCSQTHELCNKQNQGVLPTRLVSIANDVPHVVLTEGWKTKPRYSTLSHRWGSEDFLKLTAENYNSFLESLPVEALPQTFKDAIDISRKLGLSYLWIDSLCIVQGNTEDWRREAGLMSSVYGGSFINIAASSATDVHQGCFLKPPHFRDGLRARITVKGGSLVRDFRVEEIYDMHVTRSHLATRAWALQEKILPPRTIHFGNRGAFWECRTTIANEFLPDGFWHQLVRRLLDERTRTQFLREWWWSIVPLYSAADLTFSHDRLPAISGIAQNIHSEHGVEYLAGMWREVHIEAQLCWQVKTAWKRPPWRAPSWAWTSVDGGVSYVPTQDGLLDHTYAQVVDAGMTFVGDDPFGEVRAGWLRIVCSGMLAAQISSQKTVKVHFDNAERDVPALPGFIGEDWDNIDDRVYLLPLLGGLTGSASQVPGDDGEYKEEMMDELLACGIILKPTIGPVGQFHRIGMFSFWKYRVHPGRRNEEMEENLYEPFLRAFEEQGKAVAETVCEKVVENSEHPDERYVISVI